MKTTILKSFLILVMSTNFVIFNPASSQDTKQQQGNIKSIALVSTMVGKIVQSVTPLLDAGPFNKKTNSIAPLIIKEEVNSIDKIRDEIAAAISRNLNCEVLYGSKLTGKSEYAEIQKKYNYADNLKIEDDNFPNIIIPTNEMNLFRFENGKKVPEFLKNEEETKTATGEICKMLGTDLIAVSYSNMCVESYGMFGGHAQISLITYLYFYNKDGTLVAKSLNRSNSLRAAGDDVMEYKTILGFIHEISDKLITKAAKKLVAK
jgi:hypothetical protein